MSDTLEKKVLLLQSNGPLKVGPMQKNVFKQLHIAGAGEIVARFNNFTRETKHFTFLLEETDAEGKPLHRTAAASQLEEANSSDPDLSKSVSKKILKAVEECELAIGTNEEGPADPGQVLLTVQSRLTEIKALLGK